MSSLSPRQKEVAALIAAGLADKQIANALGISEGTLDVHKSAIFRRLGVHCRAAVAVRFITSRTASA